MSTIVGTNIEVTNIKYDSDTTSMIISNAGQVTIQGEGTATTNLQQGLAKCWVSFIGTGTMTVTDSFNLGSLTDNDTGDYTATFNSAMANDAYCWSSGMKDGTTQGRGRYMNPRNASTYSSAAFQMEFQNDNSDIMQDVDHGCLVITGDLA